MNEIYENTSFSILEIKENILPIIAKNKFEIEKRQNNTQNFLNEIIKTINDELEKYIINNKTIEYKKIDDEFKLKEVSGEKLYFYNKEEKFLIQSKKSISNFIVCDSQAEKKVALKLEKEPSVKFYIKFKKNTFHIKNPLGTYTPDFGVILNNGEKDIYLILETKSYENLDLDLREKEKLKISHALRHFQAIGFNDENNDESSIELERFSQIEKIQKNSYIVYNAKNL